MLLLLFVGVVYSVSVACTLRSLFTWHGRTVWPFDSLCIGVEKDSSSVLTGLEIQVIDANGASDIGINDTKQCRICVRTVQIDYVVDEKGTERVEYHGFVSGCSADNMKYLVHTIDMINVQSAEAAHEIMKNSFPIDKPVYCLPEVLRAERMYESPEQNPPK